MQLPAAGGMPPYTWTLVSGSLPPGLSLGSNGRITGIPSSTGIQKFTVMLADSTGTSAAGTYTLSVDKIPEPSTETPTSDRPVSKSEAMWSTGKLVDFWVNYPLDMLDLSRDQYLSIMPFVLGGKTPWSFTVIGLPKGLTYDPATGLIQGPAGGFADGNVKRITIAPKDADGKDPYVSPVTLEIRAGYVPPSVRPVPSGSSGTLSVSADRGMIISVSGIGDIGIGIAVISLPPGNYTVSIRNPSTGQVTWQTNVRIDSGKTTLVKGSGSQ